MNQREYRIGPGAASLMLLVVVLSMSVLGMLALMARVEAALNEAMTLEGRTVSWKETNDEGRTLACAVELEPFGAFPRFVRTVYHLAIDEGAMEGEDLLFDAGYIGEL